ncbi:glycosyltransferase family 4 protein [Halorarius litoreus]|uniref:glycosyltransferase family 4 protein n=1 Tax=Halorarius litoreus TaxID=2962676 RepID=UPI0020CC4938|nr:glycosyltransferase family 4 protein [Halorarius litoreus]
MKFCAVLGMHPSDTSGGAELQSQLICAELSRRGHQSYYVAYDSNELSVESHDGVSVYRLAEPGRYKRLRRVLTTVREIDPDVIYLRNIKDAPLSAMFKSQTDSHVVFNISHDVQCLPRFAGWPGKNDSTPLHTLYRRTKLGIRRSFLSVPDTIFVQTERQQKLLKKHRDMTSVLTGNGHPRPESEPEKHAPPVVLWLASIKEWKQPHVFVDLASACTDLECEFWLVGRPSTRTLAREIADRAESLPNLQYLGGCTVSESDDYIERASVFVNTSKQEGFPNTFIQSWFRKTPVVSLHVDPTHESVEFETGYYALESESELVDRVRELVQNPAHRSDLGEQAYRYACEYNDIQRVVDRIETGLPIHIV